MDPATTVLLLDRARGGDADALDALFARHAGRLRLYVRHRLGAALGRRLEVEDVCQETYLRVFRALGEVDVRGENAFYRYLTAVARRVLVDAARTWRAARRDGVEVPLAPGDDERAGAHAPPAPGPGPRTRAALGERQARLERAFASLRPADRRVLALRQFEQRPAAEVARLLGTTEGAVHARYRRALAEWERRTDA